MLTQDQAAIVKGLLARGEKQHDIAAFFSENGGRIAEIKTGKAFADTAAAPKKDLPTAAEFASGYVIYMARAAIERAKLGLDAALAYLNDYEAARESHALLLKRTEDIKRKRSS